MYPINQMVLELSSITEEIWLCRPSLLSCLEDYWRLMPEYQGVKLDDLEVQRILFGFFPTFRYF